MYSKIWFIVLCLFWASLLVVGETVELWSAWTQTLSDAKANRLVKGTPLVVQAIGVSGTGDAAISAEDADKIESLEKKYHFLEQGKIVIIR